MTPISTPGSNLAPTGAKWAREPSRPRILIARLSAIGDTILTTPVACRLRDRFPKAYLAWVVEKKSAKFIDGHPAVDETIVLERGWYVSPKKVLEARNRLRPLRFDATVDCQSTTKSALACWVSGAPIRIGLRGKYGAELSPWLNNRLVEPRQPHVVDRSLELLRPLDVTASQGPDPTVRWDLPVCPGAEQAIANWAPNDEFAVINPGATWPSKLWEMDRFGQLAERLGRVHGLRTLVVWAGDEEREAARQIAALSGGWASVARSTTLQELASLLRQARLLVSSDTGPLHLGVAVGAPTVGLYGATKPEDCGPYGAPHEAVQRQYHEGSRRERRSADNTAMRAISVDDALAACGRVLESTASRFPHAPAAMAC